MSFCLAAEYHNPVIDDNIRNLRFLSYFFEFEIQFLLTIMPKNNLNRKKRFVRLILHYD